MKWIDWCICLTIYKVERSYAQTGVGLLVLDGLLVTLSPLFLHDDLHTAFRVFQDSCLDMHGTLWQDWGPAKRVVSRTKFVYLIQLQDVSDADVFEAGYGEKIARCEKVLATDDRRDDIMCWLCMDELESGASILGKRGRSEGMCGTRPSLSREPCISRQLSWNTRKAVWRSS